MARVMDLAVALILESVGFTLDGSVSASKSPAYPFWMAIGLPPTSVGWYPGGVSRYVLPSGRVTVPRGTIISAPFCGSFIPCMASVHKLLLTAPCVLLTAILNRSTPSSVLGTMPFDIESA